MDQQINIYEEFANYDWESFTEFQQGLKEILDNYLDRMKEQDPSQTSIPPAEKQQLIDQAKCFFYCQETGNILSLDDFYAWKREKEVQPKILEIKEETAETIDPPYSSNYQEVVQLILEGKPIPGLKEIPDTVLTEKASKSTAEQRPKPWEITRADE